MTKAFPINMSALFFSFDISLTRMLFNPKSPNKTKKEIYVKMNVYLPYPSGPRYLVRDVVTIIDRTRVIVLPTI